MRLQLLVMISWLLLAVNGQLIDSGWGWVSCSPQVAGLVFGAANIPFGKLRGRLQ